MYVTGITEAQQDHETVLKLLREVEELKKLNSELQTRAQD